MSGSHGSGMVDALSDYDLYVYSDQPIHADARRSVLHAYCRSMEWDNRFWETEDDGLLADGTPVEFIYRSFNWLEGVLTPVVEGAQASVGYTTCFWANLLNSRILFDRHGRAAALQARFKVPYPARLQQAIIAKNLPLLAHASCSYLHQIEFALQRDDRLSVQHRLAGLLASYFDILFAAYQKPHPGEKRLLLHLAALPDAPDHGIHRLLAAAVVSPAELPGLLRQLDTDLRAWLKTRNLQD